MKSQEFIQEWEKKNNPFYPNEMKWDRAKISNMLYDFDKLNLVNQSEKLELINEIVNKPEYSTESNEYKIWQIINK